MREESEIEVFIPPAPSLPGCLAMTARLDKSDLLHKIISSQVPVTIPSPHFFKPRGVKSLNTSSSGVLHYSCGSFI